MDLTTAKQYGTQRGLQWWLYQAPRLHLLNRIPY